MKRINRRFSEMKKNATALFCLCLAALLFAGMASAEAPKLEGPYLVTTCGQSPGAVMLRMSALQAGVQAEHDNALSAPALAGKKAKTLIVTAGTSMKGMGAAGTNVNTEIERCTALMEAARSAGMTVVGAHIEGMARRTDSSDEASIEAVMGAADIILVVEDSDSDGFFTRYAREHGKPIVKVKDALAIGNALK